ncbi:hypothetical protein GS982_20250 [Rhodococcus hoagii]|nr:hypothetical protein [Prescottella equi]NKZ84526.1 hypothetical protein [Prescottella equi]
MPFPRARVAALLRRAADRLAPQPDRGIQINVAPLPRSLQVPRVPHVHRCW